MERTSNTIAAVMLGVAFIACTLIGSQAFLKAKKLNDTISVTGSTEKTVTSDTVKWTGSFTRQADLNGIKQGSDLLKSDLKTILEYLKGRGVDEKEITVQPPTLTPTCEGQNPMGWDKNGNQNCGSNRTVGYAMQQSIVLESSKVDEVTKIAQEAQSAFADNGILFSSNNPEYYYSKLADLKLDMLEEATKNAQERAGRIVKSTGSAIGKLQSASMGVFQVTAVNSTEVSDYGAYDLSTKEKKVTAIVRTTFSLQ
ncbi:MAG: SIMPL domain-containing protein [Patescibacteria group bacterium]